MTHDRSILPYVDTIYELTHGTLTRVEAKEPRALHAESSGGNGADLLCTASEDPHSQALRQGIPTALRLQRQQAVRNETTHKLTASLSEFPGSLVELSN